MPVAAQLRMTDHALLRWIERSGLLDTEALRTAIEHRLDRAGTAAATLDSRDYLIVAHGLVYVIRAGKIVTVVNDEGFHSHARLLDRDRHGSASGQ